MNKSELEAIRQELSLEEHRPYPDAYWIYKCRALLLHCDDLQARLDASPHDPECESLYAAMCAVCGRPQDWPYHENHVPQWVTNPCNCHKSEGWVKP